MFKIGVVSDTHVQTMQRPSLPKEVLTGLKGVDMIFHAGDIISPKILDQLRAIAPVKAVCGNMDMELRGKLPEHLIEEVEGVKIGLAHGSGAPKGIIERLKVLFNGEVQGIVFGHTHCPMAEEIDGIYFFNPGAAVDRVFSVINSYGILTVDNGRISGEIFEIEND